MMMSNELDKESHSLRRFKDETAINKQVKIAKQHGLVNKYNNVSEPHRFAKHHAMDCGNPQCPVCSNPRRLWNDLTTQEKREFQDMEIQRMRRSNGILPEADKE